MRTDLVVAYVAADVAAVIVVAALLAALARRIGQPAVMGQMIAGIALGPSLLGRLPGHLGARLFPAPVLPYLTVIAQVAVVVFMFVVGYEFDPRLLAGRRRAAALVAAAAFLVPLGMGSTAAAVLGPQIAAMGRGGGPAGAGRPFLLFMGVVTAVTALPVLAAVVRERGLAGSPAAATATAAAAIMDVAAWLALALALAGVRPEGQSWAVRLALVCGFAAVMLLGVRPGLRWCRGRPWFPRSSLPVVAVALAMGGAWATSMLGVHPIFGGFLAGLALRDRDAGPDPGVLHAMDGITSLLLPVFFAVTGLSVDIGALRVSDLALLAVLSAVAVAGKMGPAYAAARWGGLPPRAAAVTATLLNTRGVTELIALSVGLQAGLIGPRLFTVMVLLALVTTLMTGPVLTLIGPEGGRRPSEAARRAEASTAARR